jgi:hypothetical protein
MTRWKGQAEANAVAYLLLITTVKSFIVDAKKLQHIAIIPSNSLQSSPYKTTYQDLFNSVG